MYKAVIFDLDGTLVDSEPIWYDIYAALCRQFGKDYPKDLHGQILGRSGLACATRIVETLGLPVAPDEFLKARDALRDETFAKTPVSAKPGVVAFVDALHAAGIPVGVATASAPAYRDTVLTGAGLREYIASFVSADEVAHPKPAPDIYLKAAELLGVDPASCLAVEDGPAGCESAHAASMNVMGILDPQFVRELPFTTRTIYSFEGLQVDDVLNV